MMQLQSELARVLGKNLLKTVSHPHMTISASSSPSRGGFSLLEVMLATGIVGVSLLAVVCLLPVFMAVEQVPLPPSHEAAAPPACVLAESPSASAGAGKLN